LHLVENVSDFLQVSDVSTVWIEGSIPRCPLREGVDDEFLNAAWVDLEMKLVCNRV
jgi:hypothetical protein